MNLCLQCTMHGRPRCRPDKMNALLFRTEGAANVIMKGDCISTTSTIDTKEDSPVEVKLDVETGLGVRKTHKATLCAVCNEKCTLTCSACHLAAYCSKEHQKSHWKVHKKECFNKAAEVPSPTIKPVDVGCQSEDCNSTIPIPPCKKHQLNEIISISETLDGERCLICDHDIDFGDIIFIDEPIVAGPYCEKEANDPFLCLSCCMRIPKGTEYPCSKCSWPLCSRQCEQKMHSENECLIFQRYKVPPPSSDDVFDYICIFVIRCIVFQSAEKDLNAQENGLSKWHNMFTFNPRGRRSLISTHKINKVIDFVIGHCKVDTSENLISQCISAIEIYALGPDGDFLNASHTCGFLHTFFSILEHNCLGNSDWNIEPGSMKLNVMSNRSIKAGEQLTISRLRSRIQSRQERQSYLQERFSISCFCELCTDRTELGFYVSSLRCPGSGMSAPDGSKPFEINIESENHSGMLISPFFSVFPTYWKCNTCKVQVPSENVEKLLYSITIASEIISKDENILTFVINIDKFMRDTVSSALHINHYLIHHLEFLTCQRITKYLTSVKSVEEAQLNLNVSLAGKLYEYAKNCLARLRALDPGLKKSKGHVLYFIVQANLVLLKKALQDFKKKPIPLGADKELLSMYYNALKTSASECSTIYSFYPTAFLRDYEMEEVPNLPEVREVEHLLSFD